MTYAKAVEYILDIPKFSKVKTSSEDLIIFLERLGNPEKGKRIIHVAGTNGKGSVCAYLTSILTEAGESVGTFTSPHLMEITERFAINRRPVEEADFLNAFEQVYDCALKLGQEGFHTPTFFEFLFLMGMVLFQNHKVDYIVLETGLGGRLDATNVIKSPLACVITSISLDHVQILGHSISEIASEKAGIIKHNVPVVYDASEQEVASIIEDTASKVGAETYALGAEYGTILSKTGKSLKFATNVEHFGEQIFEIPFIADYQVLNSMLAIRTIQLIDQEKTITLDQLKKGLKNTLWPGRMEQVRDGVYLDGAHNRGAIKEFIKTVNQITSKNTGKIYLLFAAIEGKDYKKMIRDICSEIDFTAVILTDIDNSPVLSLQTLEETFSELTTKEIISFEKVESAFDAALQMRGRDDKVFCVGSLYLIGAIKAVLRRKYHD